MSSTNSFLLSSEALGLVLFLLILGIRNLELQLSHIEILVVFNAALTLLFKKAPPPRAIILFDDFVFFKGSKNKGEYGAFADFRKKYPEILFRKIFDYGYGSRAFIAYKTN